MGFSLTIPKSFIALDSGKIFPCGDAKLSSSMIYTLINADSSIRIGIAVTHQVKEKDAEWVRMHANKDFDASLNYKKVAILLADTTKGKLKFYEKAYTKSTFNADDAGEYVRNCTLPFENRYTHHRVVFATKINKGNVDLIYFYNDKDSKKIEEIIKTTCGMLRFN